MNYWIEKLGFWGYMQRFPINPITIVAFVVLIGIGVMVLNASIKRRKANEYAARNIGAAVMTFHKREVGNRDYADNIRIMTINGEPAHWFFLKPAVPALYLKPGVNRLGLYSEWARGSKSVSMHKSHYVTIEVEAQTEGHYSLEYFIPENRYIFEAYDNPKLFGD